MEATALPLALIGAAITLPDNIQTREAFFEVIKNKRQVSFVWRRLFWWVFVWVPFAPEKGLDSGFWDAPWSCVMLGWSRDNNTHTTICLHMCVCGMYVYVCACHHG